MSKPSIFGGARDEEGRSVSDIAAKVSAGRRPGCMRDTLKIGEITDAFITYATGDPDSDEGWTRTVGHRCGKRRGGELSIFQRSEKIASCRHKRGHGFSPNFFISALHRAIRMKRTNFSTDLTKFGAHMRDTNIPLANPLWKEGSAGGGKDLKASDSNAERSNLRTRQGDEEKIVGICGIS